jgi:hypothetical protein
MKLDIGELYQFGESVMKKTMPQVYAVCVLFVLFALYCWVKEDVLPLDRALVSYAALFASFIVSDWVVASLCRWYAKTGRFIIKY